MSKAPQMADKPKYPKVVQEYLSTKKDCGCRDWVRCDSAMVLTNHHLNCAEFDALLELQYLSIWLNHLMVKPLEDDIKKQKFAPASQGQGGKGGMGE